MLKIKTFIFKVILVLYNNKKLRITCSNYESPVLKFIGKVPIKIVLNRKLYYMIKFNQ